jgi:hypothetical protein
LVLRAARNEDAAIAHDAGDQAADGAADMPLRIDIGIVEQSYAGF